MVPLMTSWTPSEVSSLALAYIGDAVWEVFARNRVLESGIRRPKQLHSATTNFVSARAQARLCAAIWDQLTEAEQGILKRGRNAKPGHSRKSAEVLEYRHSTGFETLIGYLYGSGQHERLNEVCCVAAEYIEHWREADKQTD